MPIAEDALRKVRDRSSLFAFLHDELGWPVDPQDPFTYEGPQLEEEAAARAEVSQIVPFTTGDPLTIMLVEFETTFRRTELREVLRLIRKQAREEARYQGRPLDEFVFVCPTLGYKAVWLAHFEQQPGRAPRLEVFGWDSEHLHETRTLRLVNLPALTMPPPNILHEYDWATGRRRWLEAWDVRAVTRDFFRDYKAVYNQVSAQIANVPGDAPDRQRVFTQRLLNRLLFLQFLSKRGWLRFGGRKDYLPALWQSHEAGTNFYNSRLRLVFFSGLNNSQCRDLQRDNPVLFQLIGELPFLNGGLFEEAPEDRISADAPGAVVPDEAIGAVIGLFEQYNFTITESTPDDVEVAVDPEMLGEVFERLVTEDERRQSGSYYTPRPIVQFMCREALKGYLGGFEALVDERKADSILPPQANSLLQKLLRMRVLDPACGSGAYLLGMLHELFDLVGLLEIRAEAMTEADKYRRKLNIIQNSLYGVDLTGFAVETARLRLWLSLVVEDKRNPLDENCDVALPNLDYKVEQGDSLTAPAPSQTENLLRQGDVDTFIRLKREYLTAHGPGKRRQHEQLERLRAELKRGSHSGQVVTGFDWAVEFGEVFAPQEPVADIGGAFNLGGTLAETPLPGGFDIVLANPPYGATVGDAVRDGYFHRASEGAQSKDTYGLFVARAMQLLRPGGQFCFIISDTWRTIKSHKPLRRRLAARATVRHVLDLPAWVFDGPTVNTSILTFTLAPPPAGHSLTAGDLRNIPTGDWQTLESNLRSAAAQGLDVQTTRYARYTYPQSLIGTYDNFSFFIGSPRLYGLMSDPRFQKLGSVADVKVGLQTGDNEYYLRKRPRVRGSYRLLDESLLLTEAEIAALTDDEKRNGVDPATHDGRHFVPYDKGGESDADDGWLPNYYVPTGYFIDWSQASIAQIKSVTIADLKRRRGNANVIKPIDESTLAAVRRNPQFYFSKGITFSDSGVYSPSFRQSANSAFDQKGSVIVLNEGIDRDGLLAVVCSTWAKFLYKSFINHTVSSHVDSIKELPLTLAVLAQETTQQLVSTIVDKQKANPRYPYHLHEQKEIDALVYALYGLSADDIREVELWYCRRYPLLAQAQGILADVQQKYAPHLARAESLMAMPPGYWKSHPLLTQIAQGETETQELKQTLDADLRTGAKSDKAVHKVLRAIASFANSSGGAVLIGVANNLQITGLTPDLAHVNRNNLDGFQDKLRSVMADKLGPPLIGKVQMTFESMPEGDVCKVNVPAVPKRHIVYLENEVHIRDSNGARKLEGPALVHWIQERAREAG